MCCPSQAAPSTPPSIGFDIGNYVELEGQAKIEAPPDRKFDVHDITGCKASLEDPDEL